LTVYLDRIIAEHRAEALRDERNLDELVSRASRMPRTRGFASRLEADAEASLAVIAEIKRRSPSRGDLHPGLDPAELARTYETAGASCVSVLTDGAFFGGSADDLQAARSVVALPVLRKDFTVSPHDVCDARLMGADCLLLIVAALDPVELRSLHSLAVDLGLDVLVETHDEAEIEQALAVGARIIGVNQRDLRTFEVDHERALRVVGSMPEGVVTVAESGVRDAADAAALRAAGYDAVLVGESLLVSDDPGASLRRLRVR
jgi:indole-3-glycerol phosphate synthase